jgi:hypothetical protein
MGGDIYLPLGYCLLRYSWSLEVSTSNINSKSQTVIVSGSAHNYNQDVTVTTLVAEDDVWVESPGKYA